MDELRDLLERCNEWTLREGDETLEGTITPISFKSLGDESVAFRLSTTGLFASLTFDMVAIRVKDRIALVGYGTVRSVMGDSDPGGMTK